jgi:LGFP repeat
MPDLEDNAGFPSRINVQLASHWEILKPERSLMRIESVRLNSQGPIKLILIGLFIGLAICAFAQPPPSQCLLLETRVNAAKKEVERLEDMPNTSGHPPAGLTDAKNKLAAAEQAFAQCITAARSPIAVKFAALGGNVGFLGAPTIPSENSTADGTGRYRHYQHGSIYWTRRTEAHEVHGYIAGKWATLGWERSFLGYPVSDELATPDGAGRYNLFQNGLIYWTPQAGAKAVPKAIQDVSLVKEQSNPQVYFICGGAKLWIPSLQEFNAVGFDLAKVQVVPDGALNGYRSGFFSAPATIKPSDVFFDCFKTYAPEFTWKGRDGQWHSDCRDSKHLIRKDVVLAGWLKGDPFVNNVNDGIETAHGAEDILYDLILDSDFVDRMYGPGGLSSVLDNAIYPGNPVVPDNPLALGDIDAVNGTSRGVTYNSFFLPNRSDIHGELNAWHVDDTGWVGTRHFVGRGPAPGGWRKISFHNDANVWWPFDIFNPDSRPKALQNGDYVIMKGALWEDLSHSSDDPWDRGKTRGHAGQTEIHPIDWIVRVDEPRPAYRKTVGRGVALAKENTSIPFDLTLTATGYPPTRRYTVGEIRQLIDARFTNISTVSDYSIDNQNDKVVVHAKVTGTATAQGRLTASYVVAWRETDARDDVWVDDDLPTGASATGDREGWNWVNVNPGAFSRGVGHQSNNEMGTHQHYFWGATDQRYIKAGDTLFACIYLDPATVPHEVMLQWNDGTWDHRAYWGANLIEWGTDGTASRRYMGPLSIVGQWVRLEIPASLVGLEGRAINGMAFTLFGGRATWDYAGRVASP